VELSTKAIEDSFSFGNEHRGFLLRIILGPRRRSLGFPAASAILENSSSRGREETSSVATKIINSNSIMIGRGNRATFWCPSTMRGRYLSVRKVWRGGEDLKIICGLVNMSSFFDTWPLELQGGLHHPY
jgi:hypothetical protein